MKTRAWNEPLKWLFGMIWTAVLGSPVWAGEPIDVFRFDEARLNDRLSHQFTLRNPSADLLEVRSATPSCDCVKVAGWTPYVEAGGTGSVQVLFIPDRAGKVDYRVYLQTSDPEKPEFEFAIRGTVSAAERTRKDRDWTLYVYAEEAAQLVREPDRATWVDVRSEKAYERNRIPGSIRIPLYAVKTKGFLRSRPVVLVDEGVGSAMVEEEVRKLRDGGEGNLSIWHGGLNAWRELGGRIEGVGTEPVNQLPPAALQDIPFSTDWLVVGSGVERQRLPEDAVAIGFDVAREDEFVSSINAALAERPKVLSVLIATSGGERYDAMADAASKVDAFVCFLEGGWSAWERQRQLSDSIREGKTAVVRASAAGPGAPVRRTGCGGCP